MATRLHFPLGKIGQGFYFKRTGILVSWVRIPDVKRRGGNWLASFHATCLDSQWTPTRLCAVIVLRSWLFKSRCHGVDDIQWVIPESMGLADRGFAQLWQHKDHWTLQAARPQVWLAKKRDAGRRPKNSPGTIWFQLPLKTGRQYAQVGTRAACQFLSVWPCAHWETHKNRALGWWAVLWTGSQETCVCSGPAMVRGILYHK